MSYNLIKQIIPKLSYNFSPKFFLCKISTSAIRSHLTVHRKTPAYIPRTKYAGRHSVTMMPGCGIGPEIMFHVEEVFHQFGMPIDFEVTNRNPDGMQDDELENAMLSVYRNGVAIKGNIESKSRDPSDISRNVFLRNELDLYVSVVRCKSYPGIETRHRDIDIVLVRQNTEGEYAMLEHESVTGVVECMKITTAQNTERVAKFAFETARRLHRKKVTVAHKAEEQELSDGMFLGSVHLVSKEFPEIEVEDIDLNWCCLQLVTNPHQFDLIIASNLYGTMLANILSGLIGGAGVLSCAAYSENLAVFEAATRGKGTTIVGQNIANPIALFSASVDMLRHLGHYSYGDWLKSAMKATLSKFKVHTPDIKGTATTKDVVDSIIKFMKKNPHFIA